MLNKQLICDYINYNAPKLHGLGDKLRAKFDLRYRLRYLGPDIVPSQIISIKYTNDEIVVIANRGIKGTPKYTIPNPLKSPGIHLHMISRPELYKQYIKSIAKNFITWNNFIVAQSSLAWTFTIIPEPFELPRWYIMDRHIDILDITFNNSMSCPVIKTEDSDYNTVLTPVDNKYIQDLIS